MKSIVFDTGPIISLAMNNLLGILNKIKEPFNGEFYITPAIRREVIEKPLESKKYKFEAIQVSKQVEEGVFKIYPNNMDPLAEELLNLANNTFRAQGNYIQICHYAEMEALAAAITLGAAAVVIDERTTRVLIENPVLVKERLEKKLHLNVEVSKENLSEIKSRLKGITVLRSVELVTIAYEKGYLNNYLLKDIKHPKRELLEAVLWGVKLAGCSVSEDEIDNIMKLENIS